jgi:hypothetical protein
MGVDETGQQHRRVGDPDLFPSRVVRIDRADSGDDAVDDRHRGGPDLTVDHGSFGADYQVH